LGVLAFGIWLVLRGGNGSAPVPVPATSTSTSTTATTTAATITRPPPPTTPRVTVPVAIAIPRVAGSDFETAAAALVALGFDVSRVDQPSATVPAGTVITTNPASGIQLAPGSTVELIVSSGALHTTPPAGPTRTPKPTRIPQVSPTP
jgi:hypothetical protein